MLIYTNNMSCWVLLKENIPTVDRLVCGPSVFQHVRCVHRKWSIDLTPGHYLIFSTILFFWAKPRLPGLAAVWCNSIFHDQFTTGSGRPRYRHWPGIWLHRARTCVLQFSSRSLGPRWTAHKIQSRPRYLNSRIC